MEEMLEDTLQMDDDEEIEEEADAEVDKVLFELTNGKLGQAGTVTTELSVCDAQMLSNFSRLRVLHQTQQDQLEDEEAERVMEEARKQLSGLLSG